MAYPLVRCIEAGAKLDALNAAFTKDCAAVCFALPLKLPSFSILIEMGIPLFSNLFPLMCRPGLGFLQFMELFCSLLSGHIEIYHYHLHWIHEPYKYIEFEVCTGYFL